MEVSLIESSRHGIEKLQIQRDDTKVIGMLRDYAIRVPDRRNEITRILDRYAKMHKGTRNGIIANKAASTIVTIMMLEILRGERSEQ